MSETLSWNECFAYDDVLRRDGRFAGGEALQSPRNATTLRPAGLGVIKEKHAQAERI